MTSAVADPSERPHSNSHRHLMKEKAYTVIPAFLAGALIGAGTALYLAPQSGSQLRGMFRGYAAKALSADGPIKTFPSRGIKDSSPYLHDGRLLT